MGYVDDMIQRDPFWNHVAATDRDLLVSVSEVARQDRAAMSTHEMINLYRFARQAAGLPGDIAELGVYKGGSARVMGLATKGTKRLHLFDTFSGIPESTPGVDSVGVGDIAHGLEDVRRYLVGLPVQFYPGMFPGTAAALPQDLRFCLVNLDADTYVSTLRALEFFYPRMARRGIICMHDYYSQSCLGVAKAVDEFFADKPEVPIGLWHSQAVVAKQ